jgi:hypothetical protein
LTALGLTSVELFLLRPESSAALSTSFTYIKSPSLSWVKPMISGCFCPSCCRPFSFLVVVVWVVVVVVGDSIVVALGCHHLLDFLNLHSDCWNDFPVLFLPWAT